MADSSVLTAQAPAPPASTAGQVTEQQFTASLDPNAGSAALVDALNAALDDKDQQTVVGQKRPLEDAAADDKENSRKWPGWPGETVFRLIVPVHKVGAIIGRKGEFVKRMCEETRSRIKVVDGIQGVDERVVLVSAKEEPDSGVPPAMEGLLRVHRQVVEGPDVDPKMPPAPEVLVGTITARLLVPATQAGSLIGRQGSTIKSIQDGSGASVRVLPTDALPPFALEEDRVVEISGAVKSVYRALELILTHLRRFLVDRSVVPLFERMVMQGTLGGGLPPAHSRAAPVPDYSAPQPSWSGLSTGGLSLTTQRSYGGVPAGSQYDDYYTPSSLSQPSSYSGAGSGLGDLTVQRSAVSLYGRDPAALSRPPMPPAPPLAAPVVSIKEVTATMQIPLSYADAIIGVGGANIVYLRRTSGATVSVQESRSAQGSPEMAVEIRGSTQQVQTAEQLLQSFMAGQSGYQAGAAAAGASSAGGASAYGASTTYSSDPYASYNGSAGQTTGQSGVGAYEPQDYYSRASHYSTSQDHTYGSQSYSTGYGY